jgi:glycosyltransferase involved in cell wall biosynthesis
MATESGTVHIAHVIESLGPGGAERLLHTNLKHIDPARFRSTVVTVFSHGDHWAEPISRLGVPLVRLDCSGYRDLTKGATRLRAWLRKERPHLMHTHLWAANVLGRVAGRLTGIPVVSSVHDADYEPETWDDGSAVSTKKLRLARNLDKVTARFGCERMIAVSEYVRQSTHRHLAFPLKRIELLYNPIDVCELRAPRSKSREEMLGELGLSADSIVLLNVGRVTPQKGLLYAIRALPAVKRRYENVQLISLGGTGDRRWVSRLEAEAAELGVSDRVHILGARRDVADFLRSCDLFVFPSLHEGLGIALIEAMASGCACVVASSGPLAEVVSHGLDGWMVPPRDSAKLAEAVCMLLADTPKRASLGEAARRSALERFQPQAAADRLERIYDSVINQKRER